MARTIKLTSLSARKSSVGQSNFDRSAGLKSQSCVRKPANKTRKPRKLNSWSETAMENAVAEYKIAKETGGSTAGLRQLARAYGVPKSTFERRVNGKVVGSKHASGRRTAFTREEEDELSELLVSLARRGFPLRERDVRSVATDYATKNGLTVFSKAKSGHAGYFWLRGFLKRHPNLKVKRAEGLSAARAQAVNEEKIVHWFGELESLLKTSNALDNPAYIWNLDESGLQDVFQSKRAIGETGKQLYQVQAGEKGDTTTIVPVFNAVGTVATLLVIFKGARLKSEFCVGSPPGTIVKCSKDGWINKELFVDLGVSFVKHLKAHNYEPTRKHVLLLDGHGSHFYNVDFLEMMSANGVEVFCFPPHTSHILQPADVSVFKSLKSNWTTEGLKFTRETGGKKVGRQHFFQVFRPAWERSISIENIQAGFRKTGVFPFNRQAIPKCVFLPSLTTERHTEQSASPSFAAGHQAKEPTVDLSNNLVSQIPVTTGNVIDCDLNSPFNSLEVPVDLDRSLNSLMEMELDLSDLLRSVIASPPPTQKDNDKLTPHPAPQQDDGKDDANIDPTFSAGDEVGSVRTSCDQPVQELVIQSTTTASQDEIKPSIDCSRVPFSHLCILPQREKSERKRRKPPSYQLTSVEHFEFISSAKKPNVNKRVGCRDNKKNSAASKKPGSSEEKCVKVGKKTRRVSGPKVKENVGKTKQSKNQKVTSGSTSDDHTPCHYCKKRFDTPDDDKKDDDWLPCLKCELWAHESCAETFAVIDDNGDKFICKPCLAKESKVKRVKRN